MQCSDAAPSVYRRFNLIKNSWRKFSCLASVVLAAAAAAADEEPDQEKTPLQRLDEILVTAPRLGRRDLLLPESSRLIDAETIARRNVLTTPDALEEEVGVVMQKTELGGGSAIIRGRTGKEVLYLIDGQRFNTMTFRRNTQYLNTIDLNAIDRIEVIRGPSSVIYGSDAMGGAINLISRRRWPTGENAIGGRLLFQYESADRGTLFHLGTEGELEGFGFMAGMTWKDLEDLRAGDHGDPAGAVDVGGRQVPTGYRERDWSLGLATRLSDEQTLDFLILQSRQDSVPRSDRLIANDKQPVPPDLVNEYDPQIQRWYELRYRFTDPEETLESVVLTFSLNNPEEDRRRIKTIAPDELIRERDEILAPGMSARLGLRPHENHIVTTGLEAYHESIDSSGSTTDLASGAVTPSEHGRYPDDATNQSLGTYVQDEWLLGDRLCWTNGVRYSVSRVDLDFEGLTVGGLPPFGELDETYDDVTFSTCLSCGVSDDALIYGSVSRGFRTPNLDDLAALGDFAAGNRVPNLDLDPETVLSFELGTKHESASLDAGASGAVALYEDLLDNKFLFSAGGEDFFQVDNVARAVMYSLETWAELVVRQSTGPAPRHVAYAQAFFNTGRNKTDDEPLSKVPPPQGAFGYRLEEPAGRWFGEAFLRGALEQDRLSTTDEEDPRIPAGGTPGWWTFNLRGGVELKKGLRVTASLENIFDQRYRVHGSGIDAAGLNAVVSLDFRF